MAVPRQNSQCLELKFKNKANGYIDENLVLHNLDAIALDGERREQVISIVQITEEGFTIKDNTFIR